MKEKRRKKKKRKKKKEKEKDLNGKDTYGHSEYPLLNLTHINKITAIFQHRQNSYSTAIYLLVEEKKTNT